MPGVTMKWKAASKLTSNLASMLQASNHYPEILLLSAVMMQAVDDYLGPACCQHKVHYVNSKCLSHYKTAREWFESKAMDPFSFEEMCELLGLKADAIRQTLFREFAERTAARTIQRASGTPPGKRGRYSRKRGDLRRVNRGVARG